MKNCKYKALEQPDPVRVRQVVVAIGVGYKANVKLVSNKHFSGTIQSFDKESFVISSQSQPVKFNEVKEIKRKHFPVAGKVGIVAGSIVGVFFILYAATYDD